MNANECIHITFFLIYDSNVYYEKRGDKKCVNYRVEQSYLFFCET